MVGLELLLVRTVMGKFEALKHTAR